MPRLLSILKEKMNTTVESDYTEVSALTFRKFSYIVNLLRVAMAVQVQPNKTLPPANKMELILIDSTNLKVLLAAYKNIKSILKNETFTVEELHLLKKKFYQVLFSELLTLSPIPGLKALELGVAFSGFEHGTLTLEQKGYLIKLAKGLINHKDDLSLNPHDLAELRKILAFENVDTVKSDEVAPTVTTEPTPIAPSISTQLQEMSDEQLTATSEKIDTIISTESTKYDVKKREIETLKQELESNLVDPEVYSDIKFRSISNDPELVEKLDVMEDSFKARIVELDLNFDKKTNQKIMKMASVFMSDVIANFAKHMPETMKVFEPQIYITYNPKYKSMYLGIEDFNMDLKVLRRFQFDDKGNITEVVHDTFEVPVEAQNTGLSKDVMSDMLKLYKAMNVKKVSLHANINLGGYVWLRYGFIPNPGEQKKIKEAFVDISNCVTYGLKSTSDDPTKINVNSFNSLRDHFGKEIGVMIDNMVVNYNTAAEALKQNWIDNDYDIYEGGTRPADFEKPLNEIIGELFKKIGTQLQSQFVIDFKTIDMDISLKEIPVKIAPTTITIKTKKEKTQFKLTDGLLVSIPIQKFLTIPGISRDIGNGKKTDVFPGNPADYVNGQGEMPGALNWKGYLDVSNEEQFAKALKYSTK